MLSFENDYSEGCHPRILEALTRTNLEQLPGYGADHYCAEAAEKIRVACQAPQAQVFSSPAAPRPISWPLTCCCTPPRAWWPPRPAM